jgi:hypothetical protein
MADIDILKKGVNVLAPLNTAIKNARLYPTVSASVSGAVEKLYQSLQDLFISEEQLVFAESEKTLLIFGESLSQRDQERPHTISLLNMLIGFGLRSITFVKGLEKEELTRLIILLSRSPESIQKDGGLAMLLADQNILHILLDQKIYVAMDKDHKILSSLDITDDQFTSFFMLTHPDMDPNSSQFMEMAKDPEALSEAFKVGLSKMIAQKETLTSIQLSDGLNNMLSLLDKISAGLDDENRGILSQHVGQALIAADPAMAEQLTTQNVEYLMGGMLLQYLMAELTQNKLGVTGAGGDKEKPGGPAESDDAKNKLLQVAEKFSLRLQDTRTLLDEGLMSVLPKIIEQLIAQKEQEAMENLLERLVANLTSENSEVRISAARSLADIIEHLADERRNDVVERLSDKLIEWLKSENNFSSEHQRICIILKNVAQDFIVQRQFSEALKYVDAFNAVAYGTDKKPEAAKNASVAIIDQLACHENIDILLNEIDSPDNLNQEDTGRLFAALGDTAIDDLLDQLRTNTDSDERVRIIHLIATAKEKALPLIIGQIKKEAPWFYLRNLAYLLGQIGNEESARALAPLLSHGNDKLRQEVLKSIYRVGGAKRGSLLLAALPQADEEFKSDIVEVLGQSKTVEAVPILIDLLRNKPLITSASRTNLEEKICVALGGIGSPDAIVPLSEITSTKSFLGLRAYPNKVKSAAAKALITLRLKVSDAGPDAF